MGSPVTGGGAAGARVAGVLLAVDPASGEPPFRQLKSQIVDAVSRGRLTPGTRLPAVRTLAAEAGISTATAAKVYRELEESGVLEGRGRSGTFVTAGDARRAALIRASEDFVAVASACGASADDACDAVRDAFARRD